MKFVDDHRESAAAAKIASFVATIRGLTNYAII